MTYDITAQVTLTAEKDFQVEADTPEAAERVARQVLAVEMAKPDVDLTIFAVQVDALQAHRRQ